MRNDLLGGVSPIMVASHIASVTSAVPTGRARRQRERRAWMGMGACLCVVTVLAILAMVSA